MKRWLLATVALVMVTTMLGSALALMAQDRVNVTGTIELEDGVPILVAKDKQVYDLEGVDLSNLSGKQVEVSGTLVEGEGAPLIQVENYRQVK